MTTQADVVLNPVPLSADGELEMYLMRQHNLNLSSLASRRGIVATALFLGAVALAATMPSRLGSQFGHAVTGLEEASPAWLWLAALAFSAMLVFTSCGWRAALALSGSRLTLTQTAARYGLGSLVNGLTPLRVGGAIRLALFARALGGSDRGWRLGGAFAVIGAARALVFALLVAAAAATGAVPLWPIAILAAIVLVLGAVAFAVRDRTPHSHVAHLLDALRELARSPLGGIRIAAWFAASTVARLVGATAMAAALGVPSPVLAALIVVPALDLAGLLPLSGNLGVTSGAIAVALKTHGVAMTPALATGLAFHVVETAAGIAFGLVGALVLVRFDSSVTRRRWLVLAGAGGTVCLAAGFCATVVMPLA